MRHIFNKISYALIAAVIGLPGLTSCSDDDDSPFVGSDSHITEFCLTTSDGTKHTASIIDNEIIVRVDPTVSLDGAVASYSLCENARILPDPATVTNWDEDQMFRVISFGGDVINYTYHPIYEEVSSNGTVTLATQEDVNSFAITNPTIIEGNLIIGTNEIIEDPVISLSPLKNIKIVKGAIIVLPTFNGGSLDGLQNLTQAGAIMIGTLENAILTSTNFEIALPSLKKTGDIIVNANSAKSLQLPAMTDCSRLYVSSSHIESIEMPMLTDCTGDISIGTYSSSNAELTELRLPNLKSVSGNLIMRYLTEMETLELPQLTDIDGNLNISQVSKLRNFETPALTVIGNTLEVSLLKVNKLSMPKLQKVSTFNVNSKDGGFSAYDSEMESIDFSSLKEVNGNFSFTAKAINLEKIEFPALETVEGNFEISNTLVVNSLSFPKLSSTANFSLSGMNDLIKVDFPALASVSAMSFSLQSATEFSLPALKDITSLSLSSMEEITEFRFPDNFKESFPGDFSISNCKNLAKVSGPLTYQKDISITTPRSRGYVLPSFIDISGGKPVNVDGNVKFTTYYLSGENNISGFNTIKGQLTFSGSYLTDVGIVFDNLKEVGSLYISYSDIMSISAPDLEKVTPSTTGSSVSASNKGIYLNMLVKLQHLSFPKLTSIEDGVLFLSGNRWNKNDYLTDLNGLANLTTVGSVNIGYNTKLTDFTGLRGVINSIDESKWITEENAYNPTLQDMLAGNFTPAP